MNCDLSRLQVHGYLDGELDAAGAANFERHLSSCPECAEALAAEESLRQSLTQADLYQRAPQRLRQKIQSSLPESAPARVRRLRILLPVAAGALAALLSAFIVTRQFWSHQGYDAQLAAAVVDAHLRSLQAGHLTDVESTDQHTVKPWFDGKLDFAPPVRDFAEEGFPLTGGRLDVIQGQTVAALVYGRRKHVVNVFVWKAQNSEPVSKEGQEQGYSWVAWGQNGFNFCAVSDAALSDLQELRQLFQKD